jgi:uncharacterized membrane protein
MLAVPEYITGLDLTMNFPILLPTLFCYHEKVWTLISRKRASILVAGMDVCESKVWTNQLDW